MNSDQFSQLLSIGYELRGIEYKGPAPRSDNYIFSEVTKAAIGLSNTRGGGLVIIGVSDHNGVLTPTGLTPADLQTWRYDDIAAGFAEYADPSISFDREIVDFEGKSFIILKIKEFSEIPILCKKSFSFNKDKSNPTSKAEDILRKGACYVRSWRKPETTEIPTLEDMRSLIEISVEKGVKKFISQTHAAGINISDMARLQSSEQFNKQIEYSNPILAKIKSTGYWQIIIRPITYLEKRIPDIKMLSPIMWNSIVRRSKYFPCWDDARHLSIGNDYIGQNVDVEWHVEDWRLYQSGLFIDTFTIRTDLITEPDYSSSKKRKSGEVFDISSAVYHFTEIFRFAAQLANSELYKDDVNIHLEININGLENRRLENLDYRSRPFSNNYIASIPVYIFSEELPKEDLIAKPDDLAIKTAHSLFYRFGPNLNMGLLESIQAQGD
jgi:hypothetical protein